MAIMDNLAVFSGAVSAAGAISGQSVTGANTTVTGSNVYDTQGGSPTGQNIDLGKGEKIETVFDVLVAFAGATSVEFQFVNADDTALSTNATVLSSTGAIPIASLVAGAQIPMNVPVADPRTVRRYVGVKYVIVGTITGTPTVFASVQHRHGDIPQQSLKSGFAIL